MVWEHDIHLAMFIIEANRHRALVNSCSRVAFQECQKLFALHSFCSVYVYLNNPSVYNLRGRKNGGTKGRMNEQ